jgi:uncharacterized protein YbgA (DUF1722 family)|tara:strand:- start:377 stop:604 length:228 start_codon:yes stop_codon:yes gene_type:complete
MDIISSEEIQSTKTFKKLSPSIKGIILKRANRQIINDALIVYKKTGYFNDNIGNKNTSILTELIENYEKTKTTTV